MVPEVRGCVIDGVIVKPLKQIADERGRIMHMLREDDEEFEHFGEIYFSVANAGIVKGWHIHDEMTLNYAVVSGMIKLVLYDDRADSPTKGELMEVFIGNHNYCLVQVPPRVWNGFKAIDDTAIVANCATLAHDPAEIHRIPPDDPSIPYDWATKHG